MICSFDINNDGQLSREEFILGYTKIMGNEELAIMEIDKIMNHFDINHNGSLDYSGKLYFINHLYRIHYGKYQF